MRKAFLTLATLAIFAQFACAAVFITDANAKVSENNEVTVWTECYDESGNPSNSNVFITICEAENFICDTATCPTSINTHCNSETIVGTFNPGTYCAILDTPDHSHAIFFIVPKRYSPASIDETNITAIIPLVLAILFIVGRNQKTSKL
ncbi:MAG: hypothetical protein J7L44_02560 [Candidatus Diapherotrites archaeon]|nr:hypothetical protein [Candidatus Diapherotrites archaeon]